MMTQDRRSDFVIAAILVAIAAAPLLVFAGVIGSTAAYPLNIASYAVAIQNQCTQDLQNKMNSSKITKTYRNHPLLHNHRDRVSYYFSIVHLFVLVLENYWSMNTSSFDHLFDARVL